MVQYQYLQCDQCFAPNQSRHHLNHSDKHTSPFQSHMILGVDKARSWLLRHRWQYLLDIPDLWCLRIQPKRLGKKVLLQNINREVKKTPPVCRYWQFSPLRIEYVPSTVDLDFLQSTFLSTICCLGYQTWSMLVCQEIVHVWCKYSVFQYHYRTCDTKTLDTFHFHRLPGR